MLKPNNEELSGYLSNYVNLVTENNLLIALENSKIDTIKLFSEISSDLESYRYAPGKWTVKEVLQHIIDAERIFSYRALRFSRLDSTELNGYDDDFYVKNSDVKMKTLKDLIEEFELVRNASISMFKFMNDKQLDYKGVANGNKVSARIIGYTLIGHNIHHNQVVSEKYFACCF